MKSFFNGMLFGIILGAAGFWFIQDKARQHPEAQQRAEAAAAQAGSSAGEAGKHLSDAFKAKLDTLDLSSEQIKDELARTGRVIREKAGQTGDALADAAANARSTATINLNSRSKILTTSGFCG